MAAETFSIEAVVLGYHMCHMCQESRDAAITLQERAWKCEDPFTVAVVRYRVCAPCFFYVVVQSTHSVE